MDDPQRNVPPDTPGPARKKQEPGLADWYRMTGIGIEFIVAVLMFGGIGYWLDARWGTSPWLLITGAIAGFTIGLWLMIRAARSSFHD